jgi:hypothetical protein
MTAPTQPPAQRPSLGRIVILRGLYAKGNGAMECPAVITRVWNDDMINVTAFPDCKSPQPVTSVFLVADAAAADEHAGQTSRPQDASVAYWPPRV